MSSASLYPRPALAEREATASLLASADLQALLPLATLAVTGPDAASFLQGQVTCDMREVTTESSRPGGLLNLKGRLQISFRVLAVADGFVLVMPADQLAAAQQRLGKYAVFSKVTLTTGGWQVAGVLGQHAWQASGPWPAEPNQVCQDEGRMKLHLPGHFRGLVLTAAAAGSAEVTADAAAWQAWLTGSLRAGDLMLPAADSERFQPQELDFHVLQGVSYQKGCYLGQEIVARLYFRGQLKTRLACLQGSDPGGDDALTLVSGTPMTAHGQTVGELVAASWGDPAHVTVLALLRDDSEHYELISQEGRSLTLSTLPFTR